MSQSIRRSTATTAGGLRTFDRSLPMALLRSREAVMRQFRPTLAAHGITEQQWRVLRALADRSRPVSIGELADDTCLLGPSISRMLVSLERRRLIGRSADGDDARRAGITIAPAGRALVVEVAPESESVYRRIEEEIGDGDLDILLDLLRRVAAIGSDDESDDQSGVPR